MSEKAQEAQLESCEELTVERMEGGYTVRAGNGMARIIPDDLELTLTVRVDDCTPPAIIAAAATGLALE